MTDLRRTFLLLSVPLMAGLTGPVAAPSLAQDGASAGTPAADAPAPALPEGVTRVATVEGMTEYLLDNGLRVVLFPDASKASVTVNITYLVGSRHERYGETGMAHLLEHMVFKGTPDHPDIPQELTDHGASPNGTTWYDRTNYFESFAPTDENLEWALDLEADRMVNSFIAQEDLDSEMTVVRNEFEMGENSPFRVLLERVMSTAYLWHNYGNTTIGSRSDIEGVPIENLRAFYRRYYQPDNAILTVAGKFDEDRALELVAEKFGAIPRPDRTAPEMALPRLWTEEPVQDGEREVILRRVGDTQLIMTAYHVPAGSHPDFAAIDVIAHLLGNEPSGRLYEALVETGKAASVSTMPFQLHDPGVLLTMAELREGHSVEEARDVMEATLDGLVTEPPTEEEVERARAALARQFTQTLNDAQRVALGLSEWASIGDWRLMFIHRDRVAEVTTEEVGRVAAQYFKPSNRTVGVFFPTEEPARAEIPSTPEIGPLVESYTGKEDVAAGEAFDPTPENIEARLVQRELQGGMEIAFLPKETRGDRVVGTIALRLGSAESLKGRSTAGELAAAMLMRGTTEHTRQELRDELDRLQSSLNVYGGATQAGANLETTRENLPDVLRLVGEVFRRPAFDAEEFRQLKEERLAALESQMSEPTALASRALNRHLNPWPADHPRYTATFEEEIAALEAVTLEDVKAFYSAFYGSGGGTAGFVGDVDPAEATDLLSEAFAGWTAEVAFQRIAGPYRDVPAEEIVIETPDKRNAMYLAGMNLEMRDDDPDYPAMVLADFMLGGGFLNSRLATRLRQKEGLSYGVGSQFNAHPIDRSGGFVVYAIYNPENVEKVAAAVREELRRALEEGFTEDEVAAAREGWLRAQKTRRSNDQLLASTISGNAYLDRDMGYAADLEAKVSALSTARVNEALRRHLDPSKITIVKAGDFAGGETEATAEAGEGGV